MWVSETTDLCAMCIQWKGQKESGGDDGQMDGNDTRHDDAALNRIPEA